MVKGLDYGFNASVQMLAYLSPKDIAARPDRSPDEKNIDSFDKILREKFNTVKAITKS